MIKLFFLAIHFFCSFSEAQNSDAFLHVLKTLDEMNKSSGQGHYNYNCQKTGCEFLTGITRDDYFGTLNPAGESYKECLGNDGQSLLQGGAKQPRVSNFMSVDESQLSFAKMCGQEPAERRGHLESKYLYFSNRLEGFEQEILSNIAIIDFYSGDKVLENISCNSSTSFATTQSTCQKVQESCQKGNDIKDTVKQTKAALKLIDEMNAAFKPYDDRITEFIKMKYISDRGAGYRELKLSPKMEEEYQELLRLREAHFIDVGKIYQKYPWMRGKTFRSLKDQNLEEAIKQQNAENRKGLVSYLSKVRDNYNCLRGIAAEECEEDEFYEFIQQTPDVEITPDMNATQSRVVEINQCLFKNQIKDERNWKITKAVGEVGLFVGGSIFAAPRIARGMYVMYQEAKTVSGAASLAGVAGFAGFLTANSVNNIYKSCWQKNIVLQRTTTEHLNQGICPLSSKSFLNAKQDHVDCGTQVAIEATVLGGFYLPVGKSVHAVMRAATLAKKSVRSFFQGMTIALGKGGRAVIRSGKERLRPYTMENGQVVQRLEELRPVEGMKNLSKEELEFHLAQAEKLGIPKDDLVVDPATNTISQWLPVDSIGVVATQSRNNVLVLDVAKTSQVGNGQIVDVKDRVTDLAFRNFAESASPEAKQYVLFADLDNLGLLNYMPQGMAGGDVYINQTLAAVANNLRSVGREVPDVILKRGGDEYVILLEVHATTDAEAVRALDGIISRMKSAVKTSGATEPFENTTQQFRAFQDALAKSKSFESLNPDTQILIQRSSDWRKLSTQEQERLMDPNLNPKEWQSYIEDFARNSREMTNRQQFLDLVQPGISVGHAEITSGSSYQQLIITAEARMRADKLRSAIPGGKPSKEKVSFPLSPTD